MGGSTQSERPLARDRDDDRALARELVLARQQRGSYEIAQAVLVLMAVAAPFCLVAGVLVSAQLGVVLIIVIACIGVYEGAMIWLHRRGRYRPWMDWVNATLEVSAPTLVLFVDAWHVDPAYAFTSAPVFLYAPAIMVSALRLRRSLCLYAGALAAVEVMVAYLVLRSGIEPALLERLPTLQMWNIVQRTLYLFFAGVLGFLLCAMIRRTLLDLVSSARQELRMRALLGRQVSSQVADALVSAGGHINAERRELTVLFCDLRDYTRLCEHLTPERMVAVLDRYFQTVTEVVERHGGLVNKFIGDGAMALFGAPVPVELHALAAARAAREICATIESLEGDGLPPLRVGVAIHTGVAVVGSVGSRSREEYTAIGDTINLASRLEGLNKRFKTRILMTRATHDALAGAVDARFIECARIRGRDEPVEVFELIAAPSAAVTPNTASLPKAQHSSIR